MEMASSEEAIREERLLYLQFQDLGLERRDELITSETQANSFFLEDDQLQSRRRNNEDGTKESKAVRGKEAVLSAWNTAWTTLKDDGTAEEGLEDVGTGIGQSHRHKLLEDPSVQQYAEGSNFRGGFRGSSRGRLSDRGGINGSGIHRRQAVRFAIEKTPVIRKRVPKGQTTPPTITAQTKLAPTTSSASSERRQKDKTTAFQTIESFQRQQRQYGSGINLMDPAAFMASVPWTTSTSTPSPNTNTLDATSAPLPQPETIKSRKPNSVLDTSAITKVITKSRTPINASQEKPAVSLMDTHSGPKLAPKILSQTTVENLPESPSSTQHSLRSLLPTLKGLLSPEHFSLLEALATQQSESSSVPSIVSLPASAHADSPDVQQSHSTPTPSQEQATPPTSKTRTQVDKVEVDVPTKATAKKAPHVQQSRLPLMDSQSEIAKSVPPIGAPVDRADMEKLVKDALIKRKLLWVNIKSPGLFKCLIDDCPKTFKSQVFWEAHVERRHVQWLRELNDEVAVSTHNMVKIGLQSMAAPEGADSETPARAEHDSSEKENNSLQVVNIEALAAAPPKLMDIKPKKASETDVPGVSSPNIEPEAPAMTLKVSVTPSASSVASNTRDSRRSLALSLARQRDAIIGEHIVKTRFLSAVSLSEQFDSLGITTTPSVLATKTTNLIPKASKNPSGEPNPTATRATSGPAIPAFLTENTPFADPGAAARAQYGGINSVSEAPKPPLKNAMASNIIQDPAASTKASAAPRRVIPAKRARPSLPAFLQGATASTDLGAAARNQYGVNSGKRGVDPLEVARKRGL